MKMIVLAATLASLALTTTAPVFASPKAPGVYDQSAFQGADVEKRRKKRVKGGSGCDDAGDILEHPECR